jgi:hypothetical protein
VDAVGTISSATLLGVQKSLVQCSARGYCSQLTGKCSCIAGYGWWLLLPVAPPWTALSLCRNQLLLVAPSLPHWAIEVISRTGAVLRGCELALAEGDACESVSLNPVDDEKVLLKAKSTALNFLGNLMEIRSDKGRAPDYFMLRTMFGDTMVRLHSTVWCCHGGGHVIFLVSTFTQLRYRICSYDCFS